MLGKRAVDGLTVSQMSPSNNIGASLLQVIAPHISHFMPFNMQHYCNRIAGAARLTYSSSTIPGIVRRRLTYLVILDCEIKAAPSAMLQVVGFVEQYATALELAARRFVRKGVCSQTY